MAAAGGILETLYAPAAAGGTGVPRNTRLSRPAVRCPAQSAPSAGRLRRHHPTGSGGGTVSLRRSAGYRCAVLRGAQRLFSGDGSAHSSRRQHGISSLPPYGTGGGHGAHPTPRDARHGDSGTGDASGTLRGLRGCRLRPCGPCCRWRISPWHASAIRRSASPCTSASVLWCRASTHSKSASSSVTESCWERGWRTPPASGWARRCRALSAAASPMAASWS